jgi:hypothetical protein
MKLACVYEIIGQSMGSSSYSIVLLIVYDNSGAHAYTASHVYNRRGMQKIQSSITALSSMQVYKTS